MLFLFLQKIYPALFEKEDSRYTVTFPDLPEAITCGDTSEQAIETAKEC
ncbi:MAG: type II toxin-antitoxin system HicB family antitoxin [[Clostridium] innocuum]|nr:type II toxin-antitoxin system HicB family antitoxin [Erysipelotrichaceae bacterium]